MCCLWLLLQAVGILEEYHLQSEEDEQIQQRVWEVHKPLYIGNITTCSELRKVLLLVLSVTLFFCLLIKHPRNRRMDLCHIHWEDVFGPSLGRGWMLRSKVQVIPGTKNMLCTPLTRLPQQQWKGQFCCMTQTCSLPGVGGLHAVCLVKHL